MALSTDFNVTFHFADAEVAKRFMKLVETQQNIEVSHNERIAVWVEGPIVDELRTMPDGDPKTWERWLEGNEYRVAFDFDPEPVAEENEEE